MAGAISVSFQKVWMASVAVPVVYLVAQPKLPDVLPEICLPLLVLAALSINWTTWFIWYAFVWPKFFSPLRHLPTPQEKSIPLIGQMMAIAERPAGTRFLRWLNTVPNNGLIRFSGILNSEMLLLASPKAIGEVLVQRAYDFEKPTGVRSLLRVVLGDGLVVTEGDVHKFQRKHIMPSFSFRSIRALYPIFWSKAAELHDVISAEVGADGKVIEINGWANKVTMDVIGLATMGRNFGTMRHAGDELIRDYETILEPTREKTLYFVVHTIFPRWFIRMWPWRLNQLLANTMKSLNGISLQLVKDKKELVRREEKIEGGEDGDELPKGNVDILSSLIRSNDFNEEMLVDQMLTFLAAGHETTSSAFTWATHLLAEHPEIQSALRAEVRAALPSPLSSHAETPADISTVLEDLPLLNAVTSETLRLYPTVPATVRVAVRPTTVLGTPIPRGTMLSVVPWAINRSTALWGPDALEFNPYRWIDKESGKANNAGGAESNYALLTFLHGPRSCIGERFARAELKALVAVFVGGFELGIVPETGVPVPAGAITTKPKDGMRLLVRPVPGW